MSEEQQQQGDPRRRTPPDRFERTQRTAAVILLAFVVPVIGYLLYIQWLGPLIESRQTNTTGIQEALVASQLQATARAEVWAAVTADAQVGIRIDEETLAQQSYRATLEVELRSTIESEIAATQSAELLQKATISAVETQGAVNLLAMEGTVSAEVRATSDAVAASTISAYQTEQDDLMEMYVLATVQTLYEGDRVQVIEDPNNQTLLIVSAVGASLVGVLILLVGANYLTRPATPRRKRQADKEIVPSPQYITVDCQCQGSQVLCHQCDGTGEVLYTDADTNRYMYRYCPRCSGTGYGDCEICSGRGQYYKEAKAIDIPVDDIEAEPVASARLGWSGRVRGFFNLIDQIASNQRADS